MLNWAVIVALGDLMSVCRRKRRCHCLLYCTSIIDPSVANTPTLIDTDVKKEVVIGGVLGAQRTIRLCGFHYA